jgi:hypothetical protein
MEVGTDEVRFTYTDPDEDLDLDYRAEFRLEPKMP